LEIANHLKKIQRCLLSM